MRWRIWMVRLALVLAVSLAIPAGAQEPLPASVLKQLKDATVFVKVRGADVRGQLLEAAGSGFLVHRRGDVGFLATNVHVITGNERIAGPITVVFDSGTDQEHSLSATVAARDDERDLAILRVEAPHLPRPIDLASLAELRETLPIFVVGYPFGRALALDRPNPAVTVSKGAVSSLRRDREDELVLVQISGDINPGNSGGPVVDAKGALVGVAVAKVGGTQIGLAIPADVLRAVLEGSVRHVRFERAASRDSRLRFTATVRLLDPLEKIKDLALLVIPAAKVKDRVAKKPGSPLARNMKEYKLKVESGAATGDVFLTADGKKSATFLYQCRWTDAAGKPHFTDAVEWKVDPEEPAPAKTETPDSAPSAEPPPPTPAPQSQPADESPAGDEWLGDAEQVRKRKALAAGAPVETDTALAGEQKTVLDATVTGLKLDGESILPCLTWSDDGRFLYVLDRKGILHKIAVAGWVEERQFLIQQSCGSLARSAAGLVVAVEGLQELWVFDPDDLTVSTRIAVANVHTACSAPPLSIALASADRRALVVVDLEKSRVLGNISVAKFAGPKEPPSRGPANAPRPSEFELPTISPDGRYLFCASDGALHRFRIQGSELVYEEHSFPLRAPNRLEISPDSRYVAMRPDEHHTPPGHPSVGPIGVYVFKTTDLQVPVLSLTPVSNWFALGFDKAAAQVYTATYDGKLTTYGTRGLPEKEYPVSASGELARQILVHPQGRKLLLLGHQRLVWVELPE